MIRRYAVEVVHLAQFFDDTLQAVDAFVGVAGQGLGMSDVALHLAHDVVAAGGVGKARSLGGVTDDGGVVARRLFDTCQQDIGLFEGEGVGECLLVFQQIEAGLAG